MTGTSWAQISQLFDELSELTEARRAARLAEIERDDAELARELRGLLDADALAEGLLEQSLDQAVPDMAAAVRDWETPVGLELGPYRLIESIGEGGMGEVWRAERGDGQFDQQVAIKLLKRGLDTQAILRRFLQERRILARLDHPGIVGLLDGGMTPDGRPWYAMAHVDGQPIQKHASERRLDVRQRVALMARVADAVAYAHGQLVVHRDLKPSNVLVTADGEPRLLDFGIAKLLEATDGDILTGTGTRVLSPAYAAPEQILGHPVGTATDVYALGVMTYELLTGSLPHRRGSRDIGALAAGLSRATASTRASQILSQSTADQLRTLYGTDTEPRRVARQVSGDLDQILAMALRPEPERRYASVDAFAADLRSWLAGRPVQARGDGLRYRTARFVRRNAVAVLAAAAVLAALVAGLGVALWQGGQARQQAARAAAVQEFLVDIFRTNTSHQPDPVAARSTTARELLDIGAQRIGGRLDDVPAAKLDVLTVLAELYDDLGETEPAVRLQREVVALTRRLHGSDSIATAGALIELARHLHDAVDIDRRGEVLEQARAILARRPNAPMELRARLERTLANHHLRSDVERALVHADAAVALMEALPADESHVEFHYVQGLAQFEAGRLKEAAASLQRAAVLSERLNGYPNPAVPRFYAMLGFIQFQLLDIEAALASKRRGYEAALAVQGPDHPDTIQAGMRLGRRLGLAGATHEGLGFLAQARERVLAVRGIDDPSHTPQVLASHGMVLLRAGDAEAASAELDGALDIFQRYGQSTPLVAQTMELKAQALIELDRFDQAQALLDRAAAIREDSGQPRGHRGWNLHASARALLAVAREDAAGALSWVDEYAADEAGPDGRPSLDQIEALLLRAQVMAGSSPPQFAEEAADAVLDLLRRLPSGASLPMQQFLALAIRGASAQARGRIKSGCADLARAHEWQRRHLLDPSPHRRRTAGLVARCPAAP